MADDELIPHVDQHARPGNYAEDAGKEGLMPVDHQAIRHDAQDEDWPDEATVAVIEAARQSARECTETYERIMGLLAEGERLTGRATGPSKHPKRRRTRGDDPRTSTEALPTVPDYD